mmetsp:Transcript_97331/g.135240  ORF Transcript_97331/g.135240 Transcript_97331/m.135240 type:complete len:202 (+) Transcript_97331:732-1337(+)
MPPTGPFMKGGIFFLSGLVSALTSTPSAPSRIFRHTLMKLEGDPFLRCTSTTTGSPFSPPAKSRIRKLTQSLVVHLALAILPSYSASTDSNRSALEMRLATSLAGTPGISRWVLSRGKSTGTSSNGSVIFQFSSFHSFFTEIDERRTVRVGRLIPKGGAFPNFGPPTKDPNSKLGPRVATATERIAGCSSSTLSPRPIPNA